MLLERNWELPDDCRIELLETSAVSGDDVIAFWSREGAVKAPEEAARRIGSVLLVAVHAEDGVVGVNSDFLAPSPRLRADFWQQRTFVGRSHRGSNLAISLMADAVNHLERRFVAGEDTRAIGVLAEIENEGVKAHFNRGYEPIGDAVFLGDNDLGAHVRVHYFEGAHAPPP